MDFLIASGNKHKKVEFSRILAPLGIKIKTADELGIVLPEVEETGTDFEDNAVLKAESGCRISGIPTLADDSGLCVDALDGAPGIYSARYSSEDGENADDKANNRKLLKELKDISKEERTAHYVCAVACAFPNGKTLVTRGECNGLIAFEEHGTGGFGYDPLFLVGDKTFAEVSPEEKDLGSHRSRALQKMSDMLKDERNSYDK